jgi:hypothetical protein
MSNEICATRVLEIFKNLGFELIDTSVGTAIVFEPHNAFIFSVVTGTSYLDNNDFPFTAKGLTKLFNYVFASEPIWGLIDGKHMGFTPRNISLNRPYVFDGPKYILPLDIRTEEDSHQWISRSRTALKDPENYMLFRVETWKSGNGMEPLLEYIACHIFRQCGYLVETQVPLTATSGSPDFVAISNTSLMQGISDFLGCQIGGLHIVELAMLFQSKKKDFFWPNPSSRNLTSTATSVVGEAKVGGVNPKSQLDKYFLTNFYSHQFALLDRHPVDQDLEQSYLYVSDDNDIKFIEVTSAKASRFKTNEFDRYYKWYQHCAKCYLLANMSEDQLMGLNRKIVAGVHGSPVESMMQLARDLEIGEILGILGANV